MIIKTQNKWMSKVVALLVVLFLTTSLSAFAAMKIIVVSHGQASDPFWSVVKKAVTQAERDFRSERVKVYYRSPGTFDMVEMSRLINQAVSEKPDGIVVTIPDANALGPAIRNAVKSGIPVISMNSGSDVFEDLGVSAHVGQTEYEAGLGGGRRMKSLGAKNAIVLNHEVGNVALDLRGDGFKKGMGGTVTVIGTSQDPNEIKSAVGAVLRKDSSIDAILGLGPISSEPALDVLEELGKTSSVRLASFDLSPKMLKATMGKKMAFLIDQQQYLQGYLPIAILVQHGRYATMPAGVVMTGPGFVTPANAKKVISYSSKGYR